MCTLYLAITSGVTRSLNQGVNLAEKGPMATVGDSLANFQKQTWEIENLDLDGYTKTLNHRKILRKTRKTTYLKPKEHRTDRQTNWGPSFTFSMPGGKFAPLPPAFTPLAIAANKEHFCDCCLIVGHFLCGVEMIKHFGNVHLHCIVSSLKTVRRISRLTFLEKFLWTPIPIFFCSTNRHKEMAFLKVRYCNWRVCVGNLQ